MRGQVSFSKPQGQKLLAKLRAEQELWVTVLDDVNKVVRMKIAPLAEDEVVEGYGPEYLVMWGQRLWIMHPYKEGHGIATSKMIGPKGCVYIPDKYVFGVVVERHDRPTRKGTT